MVSGMMVLVLGKGKSKSNLLLQYCNRNSRENIRSGKAGSTVFPVRKLFFVVVGGK